MEGLGMKIKTNKKLSLPQLIEWAWDNDIKHRVFESNPNFDGVTYKLGFDINGDLYFEEFLTPTSLFTVEIEEEITEDMVFNYLLLTYKKDNDKIETHWYEDKCKKSVLSQSDRLMYVSKQLSITYFDDKGIPHLIWTHEKGMIS